MKTHKTLEAARYMTDGGNMGIVVSTLSEAEFYAAGGYHDITYGYLITTDKLPQASELTRKLKHFYVFVDSYPTLKALGSYKLADGKKWEVLLAVDARSNREGIMYDDRELISLAKAIANEANVTFCGLYTHCGNSYYVQGEQAIKHSGQITLDRMINVRNRLSAEGIQCKITGIGSTPNCSVPISDYQGLTEFHPGNYVFYDYQQMCIGSCKLSDICVRVLTRVIGHYPLKGHFLIDCGFTGISHDGMRRLPQNDFCLVDGHPELKLVAMTQEIATVRSSNESEALDFEKYPIGSFLEIIPYHACATAYMHHKYFIRENGKIVDEWIPHHQGW
ncbi:D-threo-3-hydroxyaspartate dehydratase isoform X2 [Nematostella vectensis]|nr:D-threo-3-hydroxyaspartate dehydratase isoform X2 [Nematostella vectensis]